MINNLRLRSKYEMLVLRLTEPYFALPQAFPAVRAKGFFLIILLLWLGSQRVLSQQLHTHSNAASLDNEDDTTSGWWTAGSTIITSDSNDPQQGSYALRIEAPSTADNDRNIRYTFNAIVDKVYTISIWVKAGSQSADPAFASWEGVTGFSNPTHITTGTTWTEYNFNVTATDTTIVLKIYTGSGSNGAVGDVLFVDSVSIVESDTVPPTAPILSTTNITNSSIGLSWTGATDDVGVTNYKVYKNGVLEKTLGDINSCEVTDLESGTTYNISITALDLAGNESPTSNILSITTNSNSGTIWTLNNGVASFIGPIAVGTTEVPSGYGMSVADKLIAEEVRVQLSEAWPDYVFRADYDLMSLKAVKNHIRTKGHLHNMPSADQVELSWFELGEMNRLLLEKIEELFLHVIELKEENLSQYKKLEELEQQLKNEKR